MTDLDLGCSFYEYTQKRKRKDGSVREYISVKKYVKKGYGNRKSRFDDTTRAAIYTSHLAGIKQTQLAIDHNCSNMTITNIIKAERIKNNQTTNNSVI